ncbi:MAG: polysaccharide biosynthesis C-terminal domain-containing protein [Pseudomonadota bacterium]
MSDPLSTPFDADQPDRAQHGPVFSRSKTGALFGQVRAVLGSLLETDERSVARRNAISAFAVRVASAGLLYVMQIALARWMGTFEYGIYVFVWTWVLVLGGLSPLGLNIIAMRLVPEYRETGALAKLRGFVHGSRVAAFAIGTTVAVLGALGVFVFEDYVTHYYVLPLYLALICVPIYGVVEAQDGMGRGYAWMGLALVPPYVLRPLLIIAGMGLGLWAGLPATAATAAVCAILATWLSGVLQLMALNRAIAKDLVGLTATAPAKQTDATLVRTDFRRWLALSAPLIVINACELVLQNADVLIISATLSPTEVAIYFAAAKTMSLIMFVHYAVGSAVANRFSALKARGDEEELKAFVGDAVAWTFWPSLAAAVVILALGQPLLWLFGPEFLIGYPVMLILVVGFLFRSAMGPSEFLLNMLGEQSRCAAALFVTAVINIVLNLILVPAFGLLGAASATSISLAVAALLQYGIVRYRLGYDIAIWKNLRRMPRVDM